MIKNKISVVLFLLIGFSLCNLSAQISSGSLGNIYIKSNTTVGLASAHTFGYSLNGNGGIINTNRNSNPGVLAFGKNASWKNASDLQHVDGYVETKSNKAFVFPIGDLGFYKPLAISGAAGTTAAYYLDNPLKTKSLMSPESDITLSEVEYWHIKGTTPTHVTLTYDSNSDISSLVGDISELRIFGWNGTSWEMIPSQVDAQVLNSETSDFDMTNVTSSLEAGNITTTAAIVPDHFEYLTFGLEKRNVELAEIEYTPITINEESIEFTVFPNPTFNLSEMKVDYDLQNLKSEAQIVIFDGQGKLVYSQKLTERKDLFALPVQEGTNGTYHVGIITESGSKNFRRVIVTEK